MATPNYSEEEIQFRKRARRRLVGAIVLVALVVAVVPLILPESKPQQDTQQIDIRIPAQDATGYTPKITPAPSTPAPSTPPASTNSATPAAPIPVPPAPASSESPPEGAAKTGAITLGETKTANKPSAKTLSPNEIPLESPAAGAAPETLVKAMPDTAKSPTFYIQYGAFSELKNAKQRQSELKAKGVPTFTEVVKTTNGDKIRVRSGPYTTRDKAEKVREKAKPLDGKLVVLGQ